MDKGFEYIEQKLVIPSGLEPLVLAVEPWAKIGFSQPYAPPRWIRYGSPAAPDAVSSATTPPREDVHIAQTLAKALAD